MRFILIELNPTIATTITTTAARIHLFKKISQNRACQARVHTNHTRKKEEEEIQRPTIIELNKLNDC